MKVFYAIIEFLTSPFTFLYRTKASKNLNKNVNVLVVLTISIIITAGLLVLFYYKRLFK